jgi:hypothetical protein
MIRNYYGNFILKTSRGRGRRIGLLLAYARQGLADSLSLLFRSRSINEGKGGEISRLDDDLLWLSLLFGYRSGG